MRVLLPRLISQSARSGSLCVLTLNCFVCRYDYLEKQMDRKGQSNGVRSDGGDRHRDRHGSRGKDRDRERDSTRDRDGRARSSKHSRSQSQERRRRHRSRSREAKPRCDSHFAGLKSLALVASF